MTLGTWQRAGAGAAAPEHSNSQKDHQASSQWGDIPGFDIKSDSVVEMCLVEAVFCIVSHMCLFSDCDCYEMKVLCLSVYYLLIEKLLHRLVI